MRWTTPVTNKTNDSFMNVSDLKRIVGNIEYTYYGLMVGASKPTPETIAPLVTKYNSMAAGDIYTTADFNELISIVNDLVAEYNALVTVGIEEISYTEAIDAAYMNSIETVFRKYKGSLFSKWGV